MRRTVTVCLAAILLFFSACQAAPAGTVTMAMTSSPVPTAEPTPAPTEIPYLDEGWDDFAPQEGSVLPRPGDTLGTWDLSRADDFPLDDLCSPDEMLAKWMTVEGITFADLELRRCGQLVLAAAQKYNKALTVTLCYEKQPDGTWQNVAALGKMMGSCGDSGVHHNRTQGDMTSPAGLWKLGTAFGNEEKPAGLKMPWRDITGCSEWVGDNDSIYYNTWQELGDPNLKDTWDDAEHLADYQKQYALACVIRFNMPPYAERYKGSAIFFHCSTGSTAGCIGLSHDKFKEVLLWLDPAQNPHILITGYGK